MIYMSALTGINYIRGYSKDNLQLQQLKKILPLCWSIKPWGGDLGLLYRPALSLRITSKTFLNLVWSSSYLFSSYTVTLSQQLLAC
jgi:hypothetical protein